MKFSRYYIGAFDPNIIEGSEDKSYYKQLLQYIKEITNVQYACIYGIDKYEQIYIIGSTEAFYTAKDFQKIERMRKKSQNLEDYLNNTVFYYNDDKVLLCLTETIKETKEVAENVEGENMDTVWLMLEFQNQEKEPLLDDRHRIAIRNVLIHRHLLWKRLHDDFHKNAFSQIKELSLKNKLLSTWKVGSHTPDEVLIRIEKDLETVDVDSDENLAWAGSLLQLAADSLISKLYVERVLDEPFRMDEIECSGLSFESRGLLISFEKFIFSERKKKLLNQMIYNNKDKSNKELTHANVIVRQNAAKFNFMCPPEMRYYNMYILASIVQNAVKHGKAKPDNTVDVIFRVEGKYLIIENELKEGYTNEQDENEKGITEDALKHYFVKYFQDKMVATPDNKNRNYCVRIPIVAQVCEEKNGQD